ncbi:hypothetical protein ABPG75_000200 [Micractinium tetrahymenae]
MVGEEARLGEKFPRRRLERAAAVPPEQRSPEVSARLVLGQVPEQLARKGTNAAHGTTIEALHDGLLGQVLALLGCPESWRAAALVSRRWHEVMHEDAPIPRRWSLEWYGLLEAPSPAEAAAGRIALLQRAGMRTEDATIDTFGTGQPLLESCLQEGGWQLADVLGMLGPAALRSLQLSWRPALTPAAVHALGTFSRLTSLTLQSAGPLQAAPAVGRLLRLARFCATEPAIAGALIDADFVYCSHGKGGGGQLQCPPAAP